MSFCFLFSITASAESDFNIKPYGKFYNIFEHKEKVAEIFDMSVSDLENYCASKHIEYIAVDEENSKQIRITTTTTDFSNSVVNISLLSDDKISALIPQITDISGVTGEIVTKNSQKFIKTEMRSRDSGGEYILTQYYTVAGKKSLTLSFYTDIDENTNYIEKTFESYEDDIFIEDSTQEKSFLNLLLPIGTLVFALAFIIIAITVIKDLIKKRSFNKD